MKRLFCLKAKNGLIIITSRDVNEARGGLVLAVGCVRSKKKKSREEKKTEKSTPPRTHHESRSSPANATTSRRRAKKNVPRVSPYPPTSIDTGFVEIGLVQLLQSIKTTNSMSHTRTHIPTDKLNDGNLLPKCKKRPRSLRSLGLASLKMTLRARLAVSCLYHVVPQALRPYQVVIVFYRMKPHSTKYYRMKTMPSVSQVDSKK